MTSRPSRPAARRARRAAPNPDAVESHSVKEQGRPDKASYAMILAFAAALRSTCLSRKVGCVIVRDGQVIATGYNGTPKGTWHPEEFPRPCPCVGGVSGADLSLKYCAHAEANALAQSAYRGSSTAGADIFCTNFPCIECTKLLISAGIHAIYYVHGYPDLSGLRDRYLSQAGIPTHPIAWSRIQPHLSALAKGLAVASTAAGSTKKETLNVGWGREGSAAAEGSSTAHAMAAISQRRQDVPTEEQRPG